MSTSHLKEIMLFSIDNGDEATTVKYSISHETLNRYRREYKVRTRGSEVTAYTAAKVLVLDIETLPLKSYHWSLWKQNIAHSQIISDWCMATWSAKWLNDDVVYSGKVTPQEALDRDDKRISKEIWLMLEDADVVIAHNGEKFDLPRLNTRFILNGLNPPLSYQSIDTLKLARRKFSFSSNKLDYVGEILGLGKKINTDFDLWKGVDRGDQESIDKMEEYNKRDVTLLEEVYLKLAKWMPSHPNLGIYVDTDETLCPCCTSSNLVEKGEYVTMVGVYQTYRCNNCGHISRARVSSVSKEKRKALAVSVAR